VRVSVVLPSHDYRDLVAEAVESVLAQSYADWELVIVDDGSTDGAAEVLAGYAGRHPDRIRLLFHEGRANRGLIETYRAGIRHARGDLVAFIEADDVWYPQNLAVKVEAFRRYPDAAVVHDRPELFGDTDLVRSFVENARAIGPLHWPSTGEPYYAFRALMHHNVVMTFSSFVTRRQALVGVDLAVSHAAWLDWWLLAQLSLVGKFVSIPEPCVRWRLHERSLNTRYLATIDIRREAARFKDAIFQLMARRAAHPPPGADPALITELRRVMRAERTARARRWAGVRSRALLKCLLPAAGYRGLRDAWKRRGRGRLVLSLEHPAGGRLKLGAYQAVDGWAALPDARITRLEMFQGARPAGNLDRGKPRPDVGFFYRDIARADCAGFSGALHVPPKLRAPYRVVAWDERGRWHRAFTLRLPRGVPWRDRLAYELGRWASLPGWWRAVRAEGEQRAWARPGIRSLVLVVGLPKTGTSALYYNIKNSLACWSLCLFEPEAYDPSANGSAGGVLAKILLARPNVDYASFDGFDRKVLLVRDPRDMLISGLLYSIWNAPCCGDDRRSGEWLALLRRKECDPGSLSVLDLLGGRKAIFGQSEAGRVSHGDLCERLMRYHDEHPECYVVRYEDFVDRKLDGLGRFLGFELAPGVGEGVELERVGRTRARGDWSNWFLAPDREFFRPIFARFMARYGYADDWALPGDPRIDPATGSEYVERLIRLRREDLARAAPAARSAGGLLAR
jgi:glycosyltransferase involved in cell wall biosynthesis